MGKYDDIPPWEDIPVDVRLVDVYSEPEAELVLYGLLREREPVHNISHKTLPTWEEHVAFVAPRPYQAWYLIIDDILPVGAIYLTKPPEKSRAGDEIGVFIFKAYQRRGYARAAVRELMRIHGPRRYLANINPANTSSIKLFNALGFRHIQNTYELDTKGYGQ